MTSPKRSPRSAKHPPVSPNEHRPTRYLIAFYSRTGFTRRVAYRLAQRLGSSDIEEIQDHRHRAGVFGFLRTAIEAVMTRSPEIAPSQFDPARYDVVVIGSPVWAAHVATPVRSYLKRHAASLTRVGMFCTMGSSGGDETLAEMTAMLHPDDETIENGRYPTLALRDADIKAKRFHRLETFIDALQGLHPQAHRSKAG